MVARVGRSRGFWLEPELKFLPGSGSKNPVKMAEIQKVLQILTLKFLLLLHMYVKAGLLEPAGAGWSQGFWPEPKFLLGSGFGSGSS